MDFLSRHRKRLARSVPLVGALLIVAVACVVLPFKAWERDGTPASPETPTATSWPRAQMASPEYGFQAYLWWDEAIARRDMDLIEGAGFGWVKQNVGWRDVEGAAKGAYDWYFTDRILADAEERDLKVLFRLDSEPAWAALEKGVRSDNGPPERPEDFGDFCHALAERYTGRVQAYQVWNEPNLAREWGGYAPDPDAYVELLRACYVGIKTGDPDAWVVSAGLAPTGTGLPEAIPDTDYLIRMYEAGAASYFDALGLNAPGYKAPPEVSPEEASSSDEYGRQRFFCFRHVEDMREIMVDHGDQDKKVVILEMGWTVDPRPDSPYHWHAVTPEEKADYLVRAFEYAQEHWRPWIGLMTVLSIADPRWTPESEQYWWAVTDPVWPETRARLGYEALRTMEKH
ncbi:MAG: hypothetical protein U9R72_13610 [Chloroflexota bacterium]|nr:hypothetical protein [Chloroflexota bacterium]